MQTTIHQIKEIQLPVWENDSMTGENETRVLVVFRKDKYLNGLECGFDYASIFMKAEYSLEAVQAALPLVLDYSTKVGIEPKEGSAYFKAMIL